MANLKIKPKDRCRWDLVALGEVMLRLDPGDGRIHTTRTFQAWEGGGEYNVARGLKRCFGMETAIVTAFADNPVGRLVQDLIYQGGVDQSHVKWMKYDGVGRAVRNGLNFTERGFGAREGSSSWTRHSSRYVEVRWATRTSRRSTNSLSSRDTSSCEAIGKSGYRRQLVCGQSGRCLAASRGSSP